LLLGVASLSPTIEFSGEYRPVWQVPIKAMMIQDAPPDFAHVEATGLLRREAECDAAQKRLRFLGTIFRRYTANDPGLQQFPEEIKGAR
jgi:hypothetical protein